MVSKKSSLKFNAVAKTIAAANSSSSDRGERILYPRHKKTMDKLSVIGGVPIDEETCKDIRKIVFGNCATPPRMEWLRTGLALRSAEQQLAFGLKSSKNSTRGLITAVQATMLKHFLFKNRKQNNEHAIGSLLKPNYERQIEVLVSAIAEIIWRCAGGFDENGSYVLPTKAVSHITKTTAVVVLPQSISYLDHSLNYYQDGLTETLHIFKFTTIEDLQFFIKRYLYLDENGPGALLLLYSAVLSRGIANVRKDLETKKALLDEYVEQGPLLVVTFAITGRASSHLHNGIVHVGDENTYSVPQRGILTRCDIGLLIYEEADEARKPGSRLKTPSLPIWVTFSLGHYGVLFNTNQDLLRNYHAERLFEVKYFTCGGSHATLTIDTRHNQRNSESETMKSENKSDATKTLEKLIHSKWKDAKILWLGSSLL